MSRIWISRQLLWLCFGTLFGGGSLAQDSLPLKPNRFFRIYTTEGTYMNLDVSSKDGSIVFQLLGNIFIMGKSGGRAIQLTKGISWDSYPLFSPSGDKIAFISDRNGHRAVYTMDIDGDHVRYLTDFGGQGISEISWSADDNIITNGHAFYQLTSGNLRRLPPFSRVQFPKGVNYPITLKRGNFQINKGKGDSTVYSIPTSSKGYEYELTSDLRYVAVVTTKGNSSSFNDNELTIYDTVTDSLVYKKVVGRYMSKFNHFAFDRDNNLIIGYGGKIHAINIEKGSEVVVPFQAAIDMELAPIQRHQFELSSTTYFCPDIQMSSGRIGEALGELYLYGADGSRRLLPGFGHKQYHPVFDSKNNILYFSSWNDGHEGYIWKYALGSDEPFKLINQPGLYKEIKLCHDGDHLYFIHGERDFGRFTDDAAKGELCVFDLNSFTCSVVAKDIPMGKPIEVMEGHKVRFFGSSVNRLNDYMEFDPEKQSIRTLYQLNPEISFLYSGHQGKLVYVNKNILYATEIGRDSSVVSYDHYRAHTEPIEILDQYIDRPSIANDSIIWINGRHRYGMSLIDVVSDHSRPTKLYCIDAPIERDKIKFDQKPYLIKAGKIITMDHGKIIDNGGVLITDGRISKIYDAESLKGISNIQILDASDKVVMPGFIDVHAHDGPPNDVLEYNWPRFKKALLFGITTQRDPSATLDFGKYEILSRNLCIMGPRLFGGRALTESRFDLDSYHDALTWVRFQQDNGSLFIKIHDIWNRKQRQWLVMAANESGINIIGHPESEAFQGEFNLSMLLDGFVSWEHMIPMGKLYSDAISLIAKSQTYYILTGITVAGNFNKFKQYGPDSESQLHPSKSMDLIDKNIEMDFSQSIPEGSALKMYAEDASRINDAGGNIAIGSHGDIPGYEFHWELWAICHGGIDNEKTLMAATLEGAKLIGVDKDIGSITKDKKADLLILNGNPLEDIRQTINIHAVMKEGRIFYPGDFVE